MASFWRKNQATQQKAVFDSLQKGQYKTLLPKSGAGILPASFDGLAGGTPAPLSLISPPEIHEDIG